MKSLKIQSPSEKPLSKEEICQHVQEAIFLLLSKKARDKRYDELNKAEEKEKDTENKYTIYGKQENYMWLELFEETPIETISLHETISISLYDENTPALSVLEKSPEKSILIIKFLPQNEIKMIIQDERNAEKLTKYLRKLQKYTLAGLLQKEEPTLPLTPRKFSISSLNLFSSSPKKESVSFSPRTPKIEPLQKTEVSVIEKVEPKEEEQNSPSTPPLSTPFSKMSIF
jgi:hypothetical protein